MPVTRRRRANPPEQPEENGNNHQPVDQQATAAETPPAERPAETPEAAEAATAGTVEATTPPVVSAVPTTPGHAENVPYQAFVPPQPVPTAATNGDRMERVDRQDYTPTIEGGRRTARGELFRRPPQPPAPVPAPLSSPPLQAPTHEISLPLGNLLHLAYNPGYTGAEEARSALLQQLENESKSGGRARCWSCGSLAIVYDRWNTRSRTFGEVGIAFCEICGVWSVM